MLCARVPALRQRGLLSGVRRERVWGVRGRKLTAQLVRSSGPESPTWRWTCGPSRFAPQRQVLFSALTRTRAAGCQRSTSKILLGSQLFQLYYFNSCHFIMSRKPRHVVLNDAFATSLYLCTFSGHSRVSDMRACIKGIIPPPAFLHMGSFSCKDPSRSAAPLMAGEPPYNPSRARVSLALRKDSDKARTRVCAPVACCFVLFFFCPVKFRLFKEVMFD